VSGRRVFGFLLACAIYGAVTLALFYRQGLVDGTGYLGNGPDPFLYIWMFKFLPAAVAHGQNPFILPQAWAPYGLNITQATTTPFVALAAWPLTALVGPVEAFNLVTLVLPAAAAGSAFLLVMALTGRWGAAFIGGWIFGFSTAVFGPLMAHLQTDFVVFIPLTFLALVLRLQGRISCWLCVAALSLLGVCQFLTSLETYVTLAIFVMVFASAAQACKSGGWRNLTVLRLDNLLIAVALGYAVTAVLVSPFTYYFFIDYNEIPHLLQNGSYYSTDLLNFIVPTEVTWLGGAAALGISAHYAGNASEQLGYIGLPLGVMTAIAAVKIRRAEMGKPVIVTMMTAMVLSLGPQLKILAHGTLVLPWDVMQKLPLLGNALPSRLMIFAMLFIAVVCATWLARQERFYRVGCVLVLAAAALMLPASRSGSCDGCWYSPLHKAALFENDAFKSVIGKGETVLFLPFYPDNGNGDAMLWQTQSEGYFRMANGYGNFMPPRVSAWAASEILQSDAGVVSAPPPFVAALTNYMKSDDIRDVVVPDDEVGKWDGLLRAAGWQGQDVGNLWLYRISDAAWAAIATRDAAAERLAFNEAHLAALRQAAVCLLRKKLAISTRVALTAHCLDPDYAAAPDDPAGNWDDMAGWLGVFGNAVGTGIMVDGGEAARMIAAVPAPAVKIYYPYPLVYQPGRRMPPGPAQLIFAYDPAALR
jgi:hypothetical protein